MTYPSQTFVNPILQRGSEIHRSDMTPMKVQKLLFHLNGWHLAVTGHASISDTFEVWKFGPAVSSVYHQLKVYGGRPVTAYMTQFDAASSSFCNLHV